MASERDKLILKFIAVNPASATEILEKLHSKNFKITKITLNRDLNKLEKENLITKEGEGRATKYKLSNKYRIYREIKFAEYFSIDPDDRKVQEEFNFEIYPDLLEIFSKTEKEKLEKLNQEYQKNIANSTPTILKKELERLVIELSWKSSKLEGNTYTLLDTEKLIKESIESQGHSHEEAVMILNHKKALDYIIKNKKDFKKIDTEKIQKLHSLLVKDLKIQTHFRKKKVGIIGTKYKPLAEQKKIELAVKELCKAINKEKYPLAKALIAVAMISYIQAFEDGNKRTARILATALLLAHDYCPLSYRNVDEYDYKKAIILFYEQNNITFIKQLFTEQFEFAVNEYF